MYNDVCICDVRINEMGMMRQMDKHHTQNHVNTLYKGRSQIFVLLFFSFFMCEAP